MADLDFKVDVQSGVQALQAINDALSAHGRSISNINDLIIRVNNNYSANKLALEAVAKSGERYSLTLKKITDEEARSANNSGKTMTASIGGQVNQYKILKTAITDVAKATSDLTIKQDKLSRMRAASQLQSLTKQTAGLGSPALATVQENFSVAQTQAKLKEYLQSTKLHGSTVNSVLRNSMTSGTKVYSGAELDLSKLANDLVKSSSARGTTATGKQSKEDERTLAEILKVHKQANAEQLADDARIAKEKIRLIKEQEKQDKVSLTEILKAHKKANAEQLADDARVAKESAAISARAARIKDLQYQKRVGPYNPISQSNMATFSDYSKGVAISATSQNMLAMSTIRATQAASNHSAQMAILKGQVVSIGNESQTAGEKFRSAWDMPLRFVGLQVLRKMIYEVYSAVVESTKAVEQLEIRISEIRTISQGAQLPFETWRGELRKLSDEYGATMEDVVKGTYEAISNQVVKGAESFDFMRSALKFSRTAVTDTATSIDLLSSVINAYKMKASDAESISATMFKTIEVGRVRADEMANSYGLLSISASQLGVPFTELNAAIASLTIQGVKYQNTATLLRNIMLKLIKPSEEMTKMLGEWGFESGDAAVKTLGFYGVLQKLNEEFRKGGSTKIGQLFPEMRAMTGVLGLVGNNLKLYEDSLKQYATATEYYSNASDIALESHGKTVQIEMNKIRNYFVMTKGTELMMYFSQIITATGGLVPVIDSVIGALTKLAIGFAMFKTMKLAGTIWTTLPIMMSEYVRNVKLSIAATDSRIVALNAEALALERSVVAEDRAKAAKIRNITASRTQAGANAIGTGAVIGGVATSLAPIAIITGAAIALEEVISYIAKVENEYNSMLNVTNRNASSIEKHLATELQLVQDLNTAYQKRTNSAITPANTEISKYISDYSSVIDESQKTVDTVMKSVRRNIEQIATFTEKRITLIDSLISKAGQNVNDSLKTMTAIASKPTEGMFEKMLSGIGKVDFAWQQARAQLIAYIKSADRGVNPAKSRESRSNLPNLAVTEESLAFAKQLQYLQKHRDLTIEIAKARYSANDVSAGRIYFDKAISQSDELYKYGYSYNQILAERERLVQEQTQYEMRYVAQQKNAEEQLKKLRDEEQSDLKKIQDIQTKLLDLKMDSKHFAENKDAIKQALSELRGITSKDKKSALVEQLILQVKSDFGIGEQFKSLEEVQHLAMDRNEGNIENATDRIETAIDAVVKAISDSEVAKQNIEVLKTVREDLLSQKADADKARTEAIGRKSTSISTNATVAKEMLGNLTPEFLGTIDSAISKQVSTLEEALKRPDLLESLATGASMRKGEKVTVADMKKEIQSEIDVAEASRPSKTMKDLIDNLRSGDYSKITKKDIQNADKTLRTYGGNTKESLAAQESLVTIHKNIETLKDFDTELIKTEEVLKDLQSSVTIVTDNLKNAYGASNVKSKNKDINEILNTSTAEFRKYKPEGSLDLKSMYGIYASRLNTEQWNKDQPNYKNVRAEDLLKSFNDYLQNAPIQELTTPKKVMEINAQGQKPSLQVYDLINQELQRRSELNSTSLGILDTVKNIASSLIPFCDKGTTPGSIYTNDIHVTKKLDTNNRDLITAMTRSTSNMNMFGNIKGKNANVMTEWQRANNMTKLNNLGPNPFTQVSNSISSGLRGNANPSKWIKKQGMYTNRIPMNASTTSPFDSGINNDKSNWASSRAIDFVRNSAPTPMVTVEVNLDGQKVGRIISKSQERDRANGISPRTKINE
jgi:TP901 family phage tail tape measure protein